MNPKAPTRCPHCRGSLFPGKLSTEWPLVFHPAFSGHLVRLSIGPVSTEARICKECGLLTLVADIDQIKTQLESD